MKIKFEIFAVGSTSFTSPKTGQRYERARLIGSAFDATGSKVACTCDLSYGSIFNNIYKSGDIVLLDVDSMDSRSSIPSFTFTSVEKVGKDTNNR